MKLWNMLIITLKASYEIKMKCWSIWGHVAFQNVAFSAIEVFQHGQEYHISVIWKKYEEFGIDIIDLAVIPMQLTNLGIKKYIKVKFQHCWNKDWNRTNTLEGWQASL